MIRVGEIQMSPRLVNTPWRLLSGFQLCLHRNQLQQRLQLRPPLRRIYANVKKRLQMSSSASSSLKHGASSRLSAARDINMRIYCVRWRNIQTHIWLFNTYFNFLRKHSFVCVSFEPLCKFPVGHFKIDGLTSVRRLAQTLARALRLPLRTEPTSKMVSVFSTNLESFWNPQSSAVILTCLSHLAPWLIFYICVRAE